MVKDGLADAIRGVYNPEEKQAAQTSASNKKKDENLKESCEIGSSQSAIPILDIINGIIVTSEKRYLGVVEVKPIDYLNETDQHQQQILKGYSKLFLGDCYRLGIKIMTDSANPNDLLEDIENNCKGKNNPKIRETLDDYKSFLANMSNGIAVTKRYFITFEYDPSMGKSEKTDVLKIVETMAGVRNSIRSTMSSCSNLCVRPDNSMTTAEKEQFETREVIKYLYYFYNRTTSRYETQRDRQMRIQKDYAVFNEKYIKDPAKYKEYSFEDLVAPKGLAFVNRSSVFMDGLYYGYVGILGDGWPPGNVWGGYWIDSYFTNEFSPCVDVDIISKRLPHEGTKLALKAMNKFTKSTVYEKRQKGDVEAYEKATAKLNQNQALFSALNGGDEIYDTAIILTIRASTKKQLNEFLGIVKKSLHDKDVACEVAFLNVEDYFQMTSPFMYFTAPFSRLKHNTLASDLASTYCYTAYEVNDKDGFVLGRNKSNNTTVCVNNFNKDRFSNGNILVLGKSGSGKTYTLQTMGERMRLSGYRCFFILPKKGNEYKFCCKNLDGEYVKLSPGGTNCINIFQLRPESQIDTSTFGDDVFVSKDSPMKKKVKSIQVWLALHLKDGFNTVELNVLGQLIENVYRAKGITEDADSIYADKSRGILKDMPVIEDLLRAIEEHNANEEKKEEATRKRFIREELVTILEMYVNGAYSQLNHQTNVNLDNQFIIFDVDEDEIGQEMIAPMVYLAFDIVYSAVKENRLSKDTIFMDEVWIMLKNPDCASQIENAVRLVRGYSGCTVISTQEIKDFLRDDDGFGRAVLNNSEIDVLLGMKEEAVSLVKDTLRLSPQDEEDIMSFKPGNALLVLGRKDKIRTEILTSERESITFRTDMEAHKIRAEKGMQ